MNTTTNPEENYEKLRLLLSPKLTVPLPKNELVKKLITNIFTEEEAFLIGNGIKKGLRPTTIRRIRKRTRLPKKELKEKLKDMEGKGKIIKIGYFCILPGYLPGLFELYFTPARDDPERMKKAGEAHYELISSGVHAKHSAAVPLFRVLPAAEPIEKSVEINKLVPVKHKILPYEVMRKYLKKFKTFSVQPCSCRNAAKLSGNPCKLTDENFCIAAGLISKYVIKQGVGRKVSLDELMEVMKKAEKEGLVHETINMKKASMFICNCCTCCCGVLKQVKELNNRAAISLPNFEPIIDAEKCKVCEVCIKKCPMEAITLSETDNKIKIYLDLCIGCGLCASICPNDAITLKKVRNVKLPKGLLGVGRKMMKASKKLRKSKV